MSAAKPSADAATGTATGAVASERTAIGRCAERMDVATQNAFAKLGRGVARYPWVTLAICFALAAICGAGMTQGEDETRSDVIWTPTNSNVGERLATISGAFGASPRQSSMYLQTKPAGGNMLAAAPLIEAAEMSRKLWAFNVNASYNGQPSQAWDFESLCQRIGSTCWYTSVLDAFDYNATRITAAAAGTGGIPGYLATKEASNQLFDRFGRPMSLDNILGGITKDSSGAITAASTVRITLALANRRYIENGQYVDPPAAAWEEKAAEVVGTSASTQPYDSVIVAPRFVAAEGAEVSSNIRGDLAFVSASIFIIMIYLIINLGQCSRVQSRVAVALGAVGTVGVSIIVAYGIGSLLTPSSSVHPILPFLMAGIGVDDIFVLTREFDLAGDKTNSHMRRNSSERSVEPHGSSHTRPSAATTTVTTTPRTAKEFEASLVEQAGRALASGGSSMLATTVTDVVAFTITATGVLKALSWFSAWAAVAVAAVYILTCTMYLAILVIDAKRQEAGRMDFLCCIRLKVQPRHEQDTAPSCCCCCVKPNILDRFLTNVYAPFLMKPVVKAIVLIVFLGFAILCGYMATLTKQEFRREWFLPGDSYVQDWYTLDRTQFPQLGTSVSLYIQDVDAFDFKAQLADAQSVLTANAYIDKDLASSNWYAAFSAYMAGGGGDMSDRTSFTNGLTTFLGLPQYSRYLGDVRLETGTATINICKFTATYKAMSEATEEVKAMQSLVADADAWAANNNLAGKAFAFSFAYTSWALIEATVPQMVQNLCLAVGAVFVISALTLAHLFMAVITALMVGIVLLCILGMMAAWDVFLEAVAVSFLTLSVGLAVDYSLHIAHAFLHKHGSRNERASAAIVEMGASVLNGATSTFLAICLLSFSDSFIFVTFFKMFFLSCVIGAAVGLVLLPVVLSLIGPDAHATTHDGPELGKASAATTPELQQEMPEVAV